MTVWDVIQCCGEATGSIQGRRKHGCVALKRTVSYLTIFKRPSLQSKGVNDRFQ
jgi:hypothetical protein